MKQAIIAATLAGTLVVIGGCSQTLSATRPLTPQVAAPVTPFVALTNRAGPDEIYPDVPGVTNPDVSEDDISDTVCKHGWTATIRPPVSVTDPIKTIALARYNHEHATSYSKKDGELDHLISLELGGAPSDPNNLWFEPYTTEISGHEVGAHEKDKVENELKREVCSGALTITQAQRIIVADWYSFYLSHNLEAGRRAGVTY